MPRSQPWSCDTATQNRIRLEIAQFDLDPLTWMPMLAHHRDVEPTPTRRASRVTAVPTTRKALHANAETARQRESDEPSCETGTEVSRRR